MAKSEMMSSCHLHPDESYPRKTHSFGVTMEHGWLSLPPNISANSSHNILECCNALVKEIKRY